MQAPGHQLLAGAVAAGDKHACGRGRNLFYHLAHVTDGLALAHHALAAVNLLLEALVLADELGFVGGVLDGDEYAVKVEGLLDKVECALLDALHGSLYVSVTGNHDHGALGALGAKFFKHLNPVETRHLDVAENYVVVTFESLLQAFGAVLCCFYYITLVGKNLSEGVADAPLVINYQNLHTANIVIFFYICADMTIPDIIIAIDGYSSTGKSSFAKKIARKFNFLYLDSGALYRGVTLFAQEEGFINRLAEINRALKDALAQLDLHFGAEGKLYMGPRCIEQQIRSMEVSAQVSPIAAVPYVRAWVDEKLREFGKKGRIVMDGRDIGTAVFPNAQLKIFMTASEQVRAQRRYDELVAKGENPLLEEVVKNLRERDYIDSHRETNPLRRAEDAFELDNSEMTFEEELAWVQGLIQGKFGIL